MDRTATLSSPEVEYPGSEPFAKRQVSKAPPPPPPPPSHLSRVQFQNASVEESGMVSWPLLPDEFKITALSTIREEKKQKRSSLCRLDKVMQDGRIHLTAF